MSGQKVSSDVKFAFIGSITLAVVATLVDSGPVAWLLGPIALLLAFYAMAKAPLRSSMFVLMYLALTLENPSEQPGAGLWQSPLFTLGGVMLTHLNRTIGFLPISGIDVLMIFLGFVAYHRHSTRASLDRLGAVRTPKPLNQLAMVALIAIGWVWLLGNIRGGGDNSMALWQIDRVMYVPFVYFLFQAALRGPQDAVTMGKVVLAASVHRAIQARWVVMSVDLPPDPYTGEPGRMVYATTHHDSMLFAWGTVLIVALLLHRVKGKTTKIALIALPILVSGMLANNRRMVWVQIILVLVTVYLITAMNPIKRKLQKLVMYSSPLALLYIVIGWNATGSPLFKPVQTIRSAVDAKTDGSTLWREIENYNLIYTLKQFPVLGTGYGHGFWEVIPLPAVDYMLERWIPHNSVLGLWAYCGYVGYTAITAMWVAAVYFSLRAYHAAKDPRDKAAALTCFAAIPIYYVQCFGDMGLGSWTGVFMVAPATALAGKLAVALGAYPASGAAARKARATPQRAPRAGAANAQTS